MRKRVLPLPVILLIIAMLKDWLVGDDNLWPEIIIMSQFLVAFYLSPKSYIDEMKAPSREDSQYIKYNRKYGYRAAEKDFVKRQRSYRWLKRVSEDPYYREKMFAIFLVFIIIGTWIFKLLYNRSVIYRRAVILTYVCVAILSIVTIDILRKEEKNN